MDPAELFTERERRFLRRIAARYPADRQPPLARPRSWLLALLVALVLVALARHLPSPWLAWTLCPALVLAVFVQYKRYNRFTLGLLVKTGTVLGDAGKPA